MNLNELIAQAEALPQTQQQASMVQDNQGKTDFALRMMARLPQSPAATPEPPKIPSLGALAVAN